ncbi:hypothetical protein [Rhizobium sp. SSA_523]|uniref:hypothetical protein n=1 Tax=Rhizobium sp. SSA_523 TaxID=2952477 RepID=UPI002090C4F1|nr:hypothetical protein [Rhizobium sp. SSA_523]MCO5730916.1 hypothetical protein [Rhizobium sp. SSA_523]WKC24272.1 hypothetical protein QTJ18_09365 [Rhizobium sp. SSA_523]
MIDPIQTLETGMPEIDLRLFGTFEDPPAGQQVRLELKSAEASATAACDAAALRLLLNEMTQEMRAQFVAFRELRAAAEHMAAGGDEAAQKLARADLKAATDAMSLIVRTLEKVDSLQRQLSRDLADEAARQTDEEGFLRALGDLEQLIEARAAELSRHRQEEEPAPAVEKRARDGPETERQDLREAESRSL